mmetsp:Transcript_10616/g.18825  ORF Transcript_10616/g.18825 Transcript_10616/m.18825 type:complete len:209 (-) Transcript_10616:44-670(-)
MAPYDQYASAVRKCETRAGQLAQLPLSDAEKGRALPTWTYPVFDVVAKLVYPVQQVRVRVDVIAQQALGMANWGLTDAINMQPVGKGGIRIILPSQYLLHLHSKRYAAWMQNPDSLVGQQRRSFEEWKGAQISDGLSRRHINWSKEPVQKSDGKAGKLWPVMATSAKAYGELRSKVPGLELPRMEVDGLPLWNPAIFQKDSGVTYLMV